MTTTDHLCYSGEDGLHVVVRPAARTPLLLMNGIGARLEALQPFVDALHPAIPVIRFDASGVGRSAPASKPYRFRALSRRLAHLLDELNHQRVDVLGISWGGGWPSSSPIASANAAVA